MKAIFWFITVSWMITAVTILTLAFGLFGFLFGVFGFLILIEMYEDKQKD